MDEAQTWYPANVEAKHAKGELDAFWGGVKTSFMPKQDWTDYLAGLGPGQMTAPSPVNVRLLCLAGYGETKLGVAATPLEFMDPMDPGTQLRLPLGLNVLRLDRDKTDELITKFVDIKNSEGKMTFSLDPDSDVRDLIFDNSNGHVGVIRTFLSHLIQTNKRTRDDVLNFASRSVYQSNLGGYRTFLSTHEDEIQALSPLEIALLVQCIVAYKRGEREFSVIAKEASGLIKLGLVIKLSETTFSGQTTLAFPSPLHFDLTLLHRKMELDQNRVCFEQALKEMVLRMSPKLLQDSTPTPIGHLPFEGQWQDECCTSFRAMARKTITAQYGRKYNERAYLDLYVEDLEWGIELIRQGGGKQLEEHVLRFRSIDGRYRNIPMREYAVLNFTNQVPNDATLDMYDHVWHLVYNEMYTDCPSKRQASNKMVPYRLPVPSRILEWICS